VISFGFKKFRSIRQSLFTSCSDDSKPHQNHRFWVPHKPIRVCSVSTRVKRRGVRLNLRFVLIGLLLVLFSTQVYAGITPPTTTFSSFQVPNTTDQNITLACTDNNSGCKTINYNINSTGWNQIVKTNDVNFYYNDGGYQIPYSAETNAKVDHTWSFGFKTFNSSPTQHQHLISQNTSSQGHTQQFYIQSGKLYYSIYASPTSYLNTEITTIDSNVFYYVVASIDFSGTSKIYVNNVEKWSVALGTFAYGGSIENHPTIIAPTLSGIITDVNISATVLNPTQASEMYTYLSRQPRIINLANYSFLFSGVGDHNIQYFSTDNADNNETIKTSQFPQFQTTQDQINSKIILTGATIYNDYNVTSWLWTINGTPLTGTTDRIKYYSTQANLDLNVCLTTNSTDTTCKSTKTWDTIAPTIDANITPSNYGFTSTFDINYNMTCYDNFTPIQYTIKVNNGTTTTTIYNSSDANASLKSGNYDMNVGQQAQFIFTCTDDSNNTATYTSLNLYSLQFRLVNENTGTIFDLNKVTDAEAYSYDGNFIYNFKDTNLTSKNFFSPSTIIRFDFTYPDEAATKLSREIDFRYIDDTNIGVCVAEYQQFYLYRFLSTNVKPVVLYNDFAKCYNLASTTKFLYNTYQSNVAYTINKPYYLYTYSNNVKSLLALLDGSNNTEINLDVLAFNQTDYAYAINTDNVIFRPSTTDSNTVIIYFFSPQLNDTVTIDIYNGSTKIWTYTETTDTNSFLVNFFYSDLNVTDSNLLKLMVTITNDSESTSFFKYFNTKSESYQGILNPVVAIVLSFFIMFFGITMVSYRFAMGWFGLAVSLICIGILSLAPLYDYILFLQAIYLIIGLFIGVIGKEQNLGLS